MPRPEQIDPSEDHPDTDALAALAADVDRVATRLRGLTAARLSRSLPGYGTPAAAGRRLAQHLADAAATVEGTPTHPVPTLADTAVGDQVAVTGHDLVRALAADPARSHNELHTARELTREIKLAID